MCELPGGILDDITNTTATDGATNTTNTTYTYRTLWGSIDNFWDEGNTMFDRIDYGFSLIWIGPSEVVKEAVDGMIKKNKEKKNNANSVDDT